MLKKLCAIILICMTFLSSLALAVPLELYTDYVTAYPNQSRKGQWVQLMARGSGTNDMYVMEVDPTTGALPVSGTIVVSNPSVGPTGDPVPAEANYIAGINPSGDLQGVAVEADGSLNVNATLADDHNYGVVGAGTIRTAAQIGNATGAAAFGTGNTSAQTLRVDIANDDVVAVSQSGTWNINNISGTISLPTGAATEATLASVDGKLPATLGQKTMANSLAVAIASDQTSIPVTDGGGTITVDGNVNATNFPATVDTNLGAPGASTVRTAAMLGVGSTAVSNANPVPISDAGGVITVDGTVAVSNLPTTVDTNTGAAGASTIRVVQASNSPGPAGRAYADSSVLDYSSSNVGTGAWVQVDASTAAAFNLILIFSSCGNTLELGTGAPASETRVLLIPPGGLDSPTPLAIASGTRLSVRSIAGTCSSGNLVLTGLN